MDKTDLVRGELPEDLARFRDAEPGSIAAGWDDLPDELVRGSTTYAWFVASSRFREFVFELARPLVSLVDRFRGTR